MLIELLFSNPQIYFMVAIAILFGFSVHEYSHAQAAYILGDPTAKYSGRLTINPLSHFDPIGTLLIFIIGIGWGKPVPFNPYNLRNQRWGPALVGLAGPLSNFLLALFVGLLIRFLAPANPSLLIFFSIFCWLNLILGLFNLIPVPPLDGSHIFFAFLPASFEKLKISLLETTPFLLLFSILFMIYIGFPFLARPLFELITGMALPFY
jgi:Zn-dependent protease